MCTAYLVSSLLTVATLEPGLSVHINLHKLHSGVIACALEIYVLYCAMILHTVKSENAGYEVAVVLLTIRPSS